jgi:signal transduction histidine kinase
VDVGRRAAVVRARSAAVGLGLGLTVGVLASLGWVLDVALIRRLLPGPVSPTAALGLTTVAVAAWILWGRSWRGLRRTTSTILALLVLVFAAAAMSAAFGGPGSELELLMVLDESRVATVPLSIPSAVGLLVAGIGLVVTALGIGAWRLRFICAVLVAGVGTAILLGHLYGAPQLAEPFGLRMAAPTSGLGFLALGAGATAASLPLRWWELLLTDRPAALLLRRLLPLVLGGLVVTGYLRLVGQSLGWYDVGFGIALMVVVNGVIIAGALVATSLQLERQQQRAEEEEQLVSDYEELFRRQALELNDEVIQGLSAAWLALELDDTDRAASEVRRATRQAQRIARQQLEAGARRGRPRHEQLTRAEASGARPSPAGASRCEEDVEEGRGPGA